jgi:N-acetylglutamate synthase-like GNAT family acetyltransferase
VNVSTQMSDANNYHSWKNAGFEVSTDPARIDISMVHHFLTNSYWSAGIPLHTVQRAIQNSLCFGIYAAAQQVGFARAVTDKATFAYVADVFVVEAYRGRGLGKWLVECMKAHPDLQGLRRWSLVTRDAHALYRQVGFASLENPERWMQIHDPGVYSR